MTESNYEKVLYELKISPETAADTAVMLESIPEILQVLTNPIVSQEEKHKVIDRIFPEELRNFMKVLCRYQKAQNAKEIFKKYQEYYNEQQNILNAELFYVIPPKEEQLNGIRKYLCDRYHTADAVVKLREKTDLIGGFLIRTGDEEIDYSLKGRIDALQQKLTWR